MTKTSKYSISSILCTMLMTLGVMGCSEDSTGASLPDEPQPACDCASGEHCSFSELEACPKDERSCPAECPDDCTDGVCNTHDACPADCPDDCTDGVCNTHDACPAGCPDDCTDGVCNTHDACPADCPDDCTDDVCNTHDACPADCPDDCTDGVCNVHDACPAECAHGCNSKGKCLVKCGDETVKSMYFSYKEVDLLTPESKARTSSNMTVYIKTDKHTYNMETAPCKSDIVLTMGNPSIAKVEQSTKDSKNATFTAVNAGKTTCTISLDKQPWMTGSITIHVLNLDNLNENIALKRNGEYPHLHKILTMHNPNRVSQGFDFYNEEYMYFTQLPKPQITKTTDEKVSYDRTELVIFKHDFNSPSTPMTFYGAEHGQNLNVENIGDKDYLWFANDGELSCNEQNTSCTDGYKQSQMISRVLWEDNGKTMYPTDAPENYYYKSDDDLHYYYNFEPALDTKNNRFAFRSTYSKDKRVYLRIYNLSKVKAIPDSKEKYTLPHAIKRINEQNAFETNYRPSLYIKDLATIEPISTFDKKSIASQALELENGIIYTVTNVPKLLVTPDGKYTYKSEIPIYIYKMDGTSIGGPNAATNTRLGNGQEKVYYLNTQSKQLETIEWKDGKNTKESQGYFLNNSELDDMLKFTENGIEYEHNGYFEPEGIRVSDGILYLSVTVRFIDKAGVAPKIARQVIFKYDLTQP